MSRSAASVTLALAIAFGAPALAPTRATADGALAVGIPKSVADEGFAYGFSYNYSSPDEARAKALEYCQTTQAAPESAKSLCTIVGTFRNECVAVAMDPEAGTPGIGFAIALDKDTAEERALAFCTATEGPDRKGMCKIDKSVCDSSGN